jgi:hypothetical protein
MPPRWACAGWGGLLRDDATNGSPDGGSVMQTPPPIRPASEKSPDMSLHFAFGDHPSLINFHTECKHLPCCCYYCG